MQNLGLSDIAKIAELDTEQMPILKIDDIFESVTPKLAQFNQGVACSWLYAKIEINVNRYFSKYKDPVNEEELTELSMMIWDDFKALRLTEIDFIFRQAAKKVYQEQIFYIDIPTIYSWFKHHAKDVAKRWQYANSQYKHSPSKGVPCPEKFLKLAEERSDIKPWKKSDKMSEHVNKLKEKYGTS